jgi:hypothetical protein
MDGNARPQTIVNKNVMSLFQEIRGDGKNPLGDHAIGDIGDVAPTGEPVTTPRVNQDDAHESFRLK